VTRNVVDVLAVTVFRVVCRWLGCLHSSDHTDATGARVAAASHQAGHRDSTA
jgi:hypothetical protein